jgi:hypothetical protein
VYCSTKPLLLLLKDFFLIFNTTIFSLCVALDLNFQPKEIELMQYNDFPFKIIVRDGHGGGWSRKINAWHLYTLMVYL